MIFFICNIFLQFCFLLIIFDYFQFWKQQSELELVSKELNHLAAILHVYAGDLKFMK